jgi:hypothetical protein
MEVTRRKVKTRTKKKLREGIRVMHAELTGI